MTPELEELLKSLAGRIMSPEESRRQIISFAYGNVKLHNPAVTLEAIEKAYDELYGSKEKS